MEGKKPKISSFYLTTPNKVKVFYQCPICGTNFRLFESQENFCHSCGQQIDWKVVTEIAEVSNGEEIKDLEKNEAGYFQALEILSTRLESTSSITFLGLKTLFLKLIEAGYIK